MAVDFLKRLKHYAIFIYERNITSASDLEYYRNYAKYNERKNITIAAIFEYAFKFGMRIAIEVIDE